MRKQREIWELRGSDFTREGWHLQPTAGYQLMLEFLRISPSYELARKANMEGLTAEEKVQLPADFSQVLATYKLVGDIRHTLFRQWWLKRGLKIFGNPYTKPKVHRVANLKAGEISSAQALSDELNDFLNGARKDEGLTDSLLISIPTGLKRNEVIKQVKLILNSNESRTESPIQPKLKLVSKRLRAKVLLKGMYLLWIKAAKPKWEHWRLGAATEFSPTYSAMLKATDPKKGVRADEQYDRILMTKITVRAIRKFELIAENAARGKFPSQEPVEMSNFNYPMLAKRIQAWSKWKKEEKLRLTTLGAKPQ